jgi:hypothetical protein
MQKDTPNMLLNEKDWMILREAMNQRKRSEGVEWDDDDYQISSFHDSGKEKIEVASIPVCRSPADNTEKHNFQFKPPQPA